jgi:hypothetical protein
VGHPGPYTMVTVSVLGVKREEREANHQLPPSSKVKNAWGFTFPSHIHLWRGALVYEKHKLSAPSFVDEESVLRS